MESVSKWLLTDAEKDSFIATLTPHLAILRTQAGVSQEELANLIGVSRQTYSSIERKVRKMSWNTYLSLVLFYDHNQKTHQLMRHLSLFPTGLVVRFNEGVDFSSFELSEFLGEKMQDIVDRLDDQSLQTIRQTISYGASVSSYWLYTWDAEEDEWSYFCSVSDLSEEEYNYYDDEDEKLEKLVNNIGRTFIKNTMNDGIELSKDAVKRINAMFEADTLDEVELLDVD